MSSKHAKVGFWISTWWPVILAVTVICMESTEFMGADHTAGPFRKITEFLFGPMSDAQLEVFHHHLRKCGHFLGYGLVGLSWLRAWLRVLPRRSFAFCAALALTCTFLIASGDEWHQSMLPNRTGMFRDVLLDTAGAVVLILLDFLILFFFRRASLRVGLRARSAR